MPFHNEGLPTQSRHEFCLALKAARERKGISLSQIADATKIPASLFAGLERNDLRRWPRGLFRRSFFRDYARAIGLPLAEACDEFVRLFPDDGGPKTSGAPSESTETEQGNSGVRLSFDVTWHGHREPFFARVKTASLDAIAVAFLALLLIWASDLTLAWSAAIVAMVYFCASTVVFGESAAKWLMARRGSSGGWPRFEPAWSRVTGIFSSVFGKPDSPPAEPADESQPRPWISDARRVGVRVKLFQ
ncbi:MAG TPA: helix-turn-helix transcriptional regulator [Vicinamibacterales bacterium]